VGEDLSVLGGIWLIFHHPLVMVLLVLGFTAAAAWLIPRLYRLAKRGFQALRARLRGARPVATVANASASPPSVRE